MPHDPFIRFERISKRFPGVAALQNVTFDVSSGSCHAVVGENGAGKSTLGRILAGIHPCDEGRMLIDGKACRFDDPRAAIAAGIGIVHQEPAFCENLSVAENLCMGALPANGPFLSARRMVERARWMLETIDARIDARREVGALSVAQQQMVQIAAAVASGARVIVFDEPTSSLSRVEAGRLFERIRWLRDRGVTILYISHRLDEIFDLCDTVTVLRDGRHVNTLPVAQLDEAALVGMMIGRALEAYFPSHIHTEPGEALLRVERLSSPGKFRDISFAVRAGEIVGMAGLVGAGRTAAAEAVFGLDPMATGRVYVRDEPVRIRHPADAMRLGVGLVPEDRKRFGLVLSMRVRENVTLPILERMARSGWVSTRREAVVTDRYIDRLRVRASGAEAVAAGLSGGNQQKLVLAKWLAARCRVLIVDEPTRGVDVGTKAEIHALLDRLAGEGSGILLISSELPEILNLSTRILVWRYGRIVGELAHDEADQASVMRLMAGM